MDKIKNLCYDEDVILGQVYSYICSTYSEHYQLGQIQLLDVINSNGDAESFCRGNALKYLMRYGKKNGVNEKDIYKAIHYLILLLHFTTGGKKHEIISTNTEDT